MAKQSAQKSFIKDIADKNILPWPFSAAILAQVNKINIVIIRNEYNYACNPGQIKPNLSQLL